MTDIKNPEAIPLDPSEITEEARKKKEILDKVESSGKPVKTILKEMGISRSTFYHWRKRYDEEGMAGLMDLRTGPKEKAEEPAPAPAEPEPVEAVVEEAVVEEAEDVAPVPEEEAPKPRVEAPGPPPGGGLMEEKRGLGLYYLIAGTLLVIGLLVAVSLANSSRHFFKIEDGKIVLYRGKFAPSGTLKVDDFEPISAGDLDVAPVLDQMFYGRVAAETGLYNYFINQATAEFKNDDGANLARAQSLLALAEKLAERGVLKGSGVETRAKIFLALQKVEYAERLLEKTYREAQPILADALKNGSNYDEAMLKEKLDRIKAYLGPPKEAVEEVEETPGAKAEEDEAVEPEEQIVEKPKVKEEAKPAPAAKEKAEEAVAEPAAPTVPKEVKPEAKPAPAPKAKAEEPTADTVVSH